ncbi:DUF5317 domain-containing protein [Parafrankia elaeagni]|uniref:DUF5317 domain-containing protein n=1 Tax=Parafrankia elaeagni TaxID=222534 RepID=UPI001E4F1EC3|nr:DUF5317 domain-containing protein [Parafrankia elaeagni]
MGLARGGTLDALSRVYIARPLLFVGVVAVLAFGRLVGPLHSPAWILASAGLLAFALTNSRLPGLPLLCAGVILNAVVISANGGDMPVSEWGADRAGVPVEDIRSSDFHTVADSGTSLRLLSDILPLPTPAAPAVVSLGDVLMAAGLGLFGGVAPVRARRTLQARLAATLGRPRRSTPAPFDPDPQGHGDSDSRAPGPQDGNSLDEDQYDEPDDGPADDIALEDDPADDGPDHLEPDHLEPVGHEPVGMLPDQEPPTGVRGAAVPVGATAAGDGRSGAGPGGDHPAAGLSVGDAGGGGPDSGAGADDDDPGEDGRTGTGGTAVGGPPAAEPGGHRSGDTRQPVD